MKQLSEEQQLKIQHLQKAIAALESATMHVEAALGESDVSAEYVKEFSNLMLDLEDDITDVSEPAS